MLILCLACRSSASGNLFPKRTPTHGHGATGELVGPLEAEVQRLIEDRVADGTQRTYEVGWNGYHAFCRDHNRLEVPATDHGLCHFVASLSNACRTAETAQVYFMAVRNVHLRQGADVEVVKSPRLAATLCGLRRRYTGSANRRPPVTVAQLNACKVQLDQIALPARDSWFVLAALSRSFLSLLSPSSQPLSTVSVRTVALKLVTKPILLNRPSGLSDYHLGGRAG